MLHQDAADLSVLYVGGTGIISSACVALSVEAGMRVTVINRGRNESSRYVPDAVESLTADVADDDAMAAALGDRTFDSVVNFLSYDVPDVDRFVALFTGRTRQYVHISSASIYAKPIRQIPLTESSPTGPNPPSEYATAKWRAEQALLAAYCDGGFPVTIVRPSHTYDDARPPLPGDWTVVDRLARGAEVPVPGDGTSLWTLTHAEDFAQGLVGLLGNPRAIGDTFHITGDDIYTWDQIYTIVARALGTEPRLVHVPSEMLPIVAPDWGWTGGILGDIAHSAVFDNTKIRTYVPGFAPRLTFHRAIHRMLAWRRDHSDVTRPDPATDAILDRIVGACHDARAVYEKAAPTS
jgi:nucleoside-diphosphate-sugar epimerase